MIIDITGTELIPGNLGIDCPGNGKHTRKDGSIIECCCDECDFYLCCIDVLSETECENCNCKDCYRCKKRGFFSILKDILYRLFYKFKKL